MNHYMDPQRMREILESLTEGGLREYCEPLSMESLSVFAEFSFGVRDGQNMTRDELMERIVEKRTSDHGW